MNVIDDFEKTITFLVDNLPVKKKEKKENGEVFTPPDLIHEKFNALKKAVPDIWNNPRRKFLDPANGIGNYPAVAFHRLMDGLNEVIPCKMERKKHILENMLYMCELNKNNVDKCRFLFDPSNEYKLNLYEGSFFDLDIKKEWGIELFDVVMGNPPFNSGSIRSATRTRTDDDLNEKKKYRGLWTIFVKNSMDILKPQGILAFITPASWFRTTMKTRESLLTNTIKWVRIIDHNQSKKEINANITISIYILINTPNINQEKTTIITAYGNSEHYLDIKYSIPMAYHNIILKLFEFNDMKNCRLDVKCGNRPCLLNDNMKQKIPDEYKLEDKWAVVTYLVNGGLRGYITDRQTPSASMRKIIIANKIGLDGIFIDEGKLEVNASSTRNYYILGDNLELILKIMKFKLFKIVIDHTKYSMSFADIAGLKNISDLRMLCITDITENEYYKLIGYNDDEIKIIKEY